MEQLTYEKCNGINCKKIIASTPDKAYEFCSYECKTSKSG